MLEHTSQIGRVLIVTEDRSRVDPVAEALKGRHQVDVVTGSFGSRESSGSDSTDLIIVDLVGRRAVDACRTFKRKPGLAYVPIVVLTDDEELSMDVLTEGAIDCFSPGVSRRLLMSKVGNLISWKRAHDVHLKAETEARERVEELQSFVQMVTHDLKSPVIAAGGFVKLLRKLLEESQPDPKTTEILGYLSNACAKIQDFINDLSQLILIENTPLQWTALALDSAVEEVVEQYEHTMHERRIALKLELDDFHGGLLGDRHRIMQVLDNLVSNAIHHMGDVPDASICIELKDTGESVVTRVSDNGVGIPPQYHDKIFRRFFRVPRTGGKPGTGLGLAIAKSIIESHQGNLWIEAETERGTAFSFSLPKASSPYCGMTAEGGRQDS